MPLLHTQHAFPLLTERQPLVQPAQIFLRQGIMELSKHGGKCGNGGLIGRTAIVDPMPLMALVDEASLGEDFQVP